MAQRRDLLGGGQLPATWDRALAIPQGRLYTSARRENQPVGGIAAEKLEATSNRVGLIGGMFANGTIVADHQARSSAHFISFPAVRQMGFAGRLLNNDEVMPG